MAICRTQSCEVCWRIASVQVLACKTAADASVTKLLENEMGRTYDDESRD